MITKCLNEDALKKNRQTESLKILGEWAIHNRYLIIDYYILFHLTHIIILPLYRDFVKVCGNAINLNELLIKTDQQAYHEDMKERYEVLKTKVAGYVGSVCYSLSIFYR